MTEEPASDHAAGGAPPGGPIGVIRGLFVSVVFISNHAEIDWLPARCQ